MLREKLTILTEQLIILIDRKIHNADRKTHNADRKTHHVERNGNVRMTKWKKVVSKIRTMFDSQLSDLPMAYCSRDQILPWPAKEIQLAWNKPANTFKKCNYTKHNEDLYKID